MKRVADAVLLGDHKLYEPRSVIALLLDRHTEMHVCVCMLRWFSKAQDEPTSVHYRRHFSCFSLFILTVLHGLNVILLAPGWEHCRHR